MAEIWDRTTTVRKPSPIRENDKEKEISTRAMEGSDKGKVGGMAEVKPVRKSS